MVQLSTVNQAVTVCSTRSSKFSYRVFVGKHNLLEDEAVSKAVLPEKIVVHEKWNPIFVAFG